MGYDVGRFVGVVDEELLCPICSCVLQSPLQLAGCEHAFCSECIRQWITRGSATCPVDRTEVTEQELQSVPRILKNLLSRLEIRCDYDVHGCSLTVRLDGLSSHLKNCEHNPKKPVACQKGCGLATIPKDELKDHNCVQELRNLIKAQDEKISELQRSVGDANYQLTEYRREISILKDQVQNNTRVLNQQSVGRLRSSFDRLRISATDTDRERSLAARMQEADSIRTWCNSLPRAKVTRWGGMISTPNSDLIAAIRRTLVDTGCPDVSGLGGSNSNPRAGASANSNSSLLDDLMANAHERRWPAGLLTLETRQMNRRQYERYICRRVPGRQAVIVMACDNAHMSDDMIIEPGIVMIFAHGIE